MDIFILKYIYKLDLIFSERGESKYALDDLPALTEIPQTIDSCLEESLSESLIDQGPFFITVMVLIVLVPEINSLKIVVN